ncbi:MAG: GPR endopeptidase [Oscillospiraceae bacterium]|nr:GPR endopeptidase [Oscillospiraceae bacterium]
MYRRFRTDLAAEQRELTAGAGELKDVRAETQQRGGFDITTVEILDEEGARSLCKPIGKYVTLGLEPLMCRTSEAFEDAAGLLAELIRGLLPADSGKGTLVAGLGNDEMTPDAVGPLAVNSVIATRHLKRGMPEDFAGFTTVSAVKPGVLGATGIESAELLRSACRAADPARLIAVDALASASLERLCRTVQLTDAGIVPGSGVGNDRAAVNQKSLGLPVLAIGVPTVVDASAFSDSPDAAGMFVTPRDIDASVRDVAKLIGYGINLALHDGLTVADIDMLKS